MCVGGYTLSSPIVNINCPDASDILRILERVSYVPIIRILEKEELREARDPRQTFS